MASYEWECLKCQSILQLEEDDIDVGEFRVQCPECGSHAMELLQVDRTGLTTLKRLTRQLQGINQRFDQILNKELEQDQEDQPPPKPRVLH